MTILQEIDDRNKIFKQHVKCKDTSRKKELLDEFKTLKNEITFLTRNNKKSYYEKYFSKIKDNLRKTW